MSDFDYDCLVIGGGPAGLTAAIYLARFHLSLQVVDAGKSRAGWIPCTHNHAGFPDGISGKELIERMKEQAQLYGASIETGRGHPARPRSKAASRPNGASGSVTARTVLLATGVSNRRPPMDEELHDEALGRGLIRYCPICDGYEVTDKKVGVIGDDSHGVAEAVFLRGYTADVTLIAPDSEHRKLGQQDWAELERVRDRDGRRPVQRGGDRRQMHHRRHRRRALYLRQRLSGARLRRAFRPGRDGRRRPGRDAAASSSTATSAPACPASTRPATS